METRSMMNLHDMVYGNTTMIKFEIDAHLLPKVLNVMELIMKYRTDQKQRAIDVYSALTVHRCYSVKSTAKHCYNLLLKCIANHRFEEAAKLYWMLCEDWGVKDYILYKTGLIVLLNLEIVDKNDYFMTFFRFVLNLRTLSSQEALLDFIMCALKYEFPDMQRQVKALTGRKIMSLSRKDDKVTQILTSYIILLDWCKVYRGDMNKSLSQADKGAVNVKQCDENSDIFILKLVKRMEISDEPNEVENVLITYAENNPDNVNALIYICTYLYYNNPDSDKLIGYLEILAEKCISDVRTLWLINIWEKIGVSLLKVLNYCYMFLNYPTNGKNSEAWKVIWENSKKAKNNPSLTENDIISIKSLWKSRKRSWTWMYFNPRHLPDMPSNNELIAYKVAFLSVLEDGEKYIKKVSKCHPDVFEMAGSLRN